VNKVWILFIGAGTVSIQSVRYTKKNSGTRLRFSPLNLSTSVELLMGKIKMLKLMEIHFIATMSDNELFDFINDHDNYQERQDGFYYVGKKGVHKLNRKQLLKEVVCLLGA
jgi:hypothetical protein